MTTQKFCFGKPCSRVRERGAGMPDGIKLYPRLAWSLQWIGLGTGPFWTPRWKGDCACPPPPLHPSPPTLASRGSSRYCTENWSTNDTCSQISYFGRFACEFGEKTQILSCIYKIPKSCPNSEFTKRFKETSNFKRFYEIKFASKQANLFKLHKYIRLFCHVCLDVHTFSQPRTPQFRTQVPFKPTLNFTTQTNHGTFKVMWG